MFQHGAVAWNAGQLDEFVSDYLDDDSRTTYIGSRGIVRGRAAIRSVYAPRFVSGAQRDSLRFENVEVDVLAPGVANAIGWYVLYRSVGGRDSVTARGPTSLVMQRVDDRWLIVHDHSS